MEVTQLMLTNIPSDMVNSHLSFMNVVVSTNFQKGVWGGCLDLQRATNPVLTLGEQEKKHKFSE